jgi:hypothetical protein
MGLGFQAFGPMDLALLVAATQANSSHAQTEANKAMRFIERIQHIHQQVQDIYISPMPSTSSSMINTRCHISFRWETKSGCTCRRNALRGPIGSFIHSAMDLTPSPRLWVIILLSSTFPLSLACIQYLMWTSFSHIFHHYWTPQR